MWLRRRKYDGDPGTWDKHLRDPGPRAAEAENTHPPVDLREAYQRYAAEKAEAEKAEAERLALLGTPDDPRIRYADTQVLMTALCQIADAVERVADALASASETREDTSDAQR